MDPYFTSAVKGKDFGGRRVYRGSGLNKKKQVESSADIARRIAVEREERRQIRQEKKEAALAFGSDETTID